MTVRAAWDLVTAKRQEHQRAAGLQQTASATQADHQRAGMEWIEAVCRENGLDVSDVLEAMLVAQADTSARNPSSGALGLFEFLPSTWGSTPFARFSPFNYFAASLAAAWMHRVGRGREWVCQ